MNDLECMAIFRLQDLISGPLRAIQTQINAAKAAAIGLSAKATKLALSLAPVALVLGVLTGAFTGAAMATIPTQKALGELASVGVKDMEAMTQAAEDFSNKWAGTTKPEFIAAAYDIKSGINSLTDAGVAGMTDLAAVTAKATKATVGQMTSLFASGYAIYKQQFAGLSDIQFGEVFSAGLSKSVQHFQTTGSQMQAGISNLGKEATNAGIAMAEQFAVLGILQDTVGGAEAGTKYKAFLQSIAKGGQKLGLSVLDANRQLKSMPAIIAEFRAKYGEEIDAIEKMQIAKALGRDEAVSVLDLLYDETGKLTVAMGAVNQATSKGREFTEGMAETMNKDLGAVLQLLGQRWDNLVEIIGDMFAPTVLVVADALGWLVLKLQAAAKWLDSTGIGAGIMSTIAMMAALTAGVTVLVAAWPLLAAVLGPVAAALGTVLWPMALITGAVLALRLAWNNNFLGMRDTITGLWNKVTLVVRGVFALLTSATSEGMGFIEGELGRDLQANGLLGLVTTVARVIYRIQSFFTGLWDGLTGNLGGIGETLSPVWDTISASMGVVLDLLGQLFGLLPGIGGEVGTWRGFGELIGTVIAGSIKILVMNLRIAHDILQLVGGVVLWVFGLFTGDSSLADLGQLFSDTFSGIWGTVSTLFPETAAFIELIVNRVIGWGNDLASQFGAAVDLVCTTWTNVWNDVGQVVDNAWTSITSRVQSIVDDVASIFNLDLAAQGRALLETWWNGIVSAKDWVKEKLSGLLEGITGLFNRSDAKEGPLSRTSWHGMMLMRTLGKGVTQAAPEFAGMVSKALALPQTQLTPPDTSGFMALAGPVDIWGGRSGPDAPMPSLPLDIGQPTYEATRRTSLDDLDESEETGRRIVIHHLVVNAPNVKDGDSFVSALQRMVEQHDG